MFTTLPTLCPTYKVQVSIHCTGFGYLEQCKSPLKLNVSYLACEQILLEEIQFDCTIKEGLSHQKHKLDIVQSKDIISNGESGCMGQRQT